MNDENATGPGANRAAGGTELTTAGMPSLYPAAQNPQNDIIKSETLSAAYDQARATGDDDALLAAFEALLDLCAGGDRRRFGPRFGDGER